MELFAQRISNISVDAERFRREMRDVLGCRVQYLIFFVPRSGSSWLTDLLAGTDLLGEPGEWFNPNFVTAIAQAINANRPGDYVKMLKRKKQSRAGVFGAEITFMQYERLGQFDLLAALGPATHFFYLRRRNLVRQAISLYKAVESDVFHDTGALTREHGKKIESVEYSKSGVERWMTHLLNHELGCEQLFVQRGVNPMRLYYEDLVRDPAGTAAIFLRALLPERSSEVLKVQSAHRPIATPRNAEFEDRFRAESARFLSGVEARRPPLR